MGSTALLIFLGLSTSYAENQSGGSRCDLIVDTSDGPSSGGEVYLESDPAVLSSPIRESLPKSNTADSDLTAMKLARLYAGFEYHPKVQGFEMLSKANRSRNRKNRTVDVDAGPENNRFMAEVWEFKGQQYHYVDVGYPNLQYESNLISEVVADHMIDHPKEDLTVLYKPNLVMLRSAINRFRWALHRAVIASYSDEKEYLTKADLRLLVETNVASQNNDVYGLLNYQRTEDLSSLSQEEIQKRLAATIQITYFGNRHFLKPTLREILRSKDFVTPRLQSDDLLPFEFRVPPAVRPKYRAQLAKDFDVTKMAEITRFAKFSNMPTEVHFRFLYKVFFSAMRHGVRTIVISTDDKTSRLFKRYGFKLYSRLPTASGAPEYLYYMQLPGRDFLNLVDVKLLPGFDVITTAIPFHHD
jgi:hypothetical protein